MSTTTQPGRPSIEPIADYESRRPGTADPTGLNPLPDATTAALLSGIPDQRTGSRPRKDITKKQVEHILGALLEVHAGLRAAAQLTPWLSPELAERMRSDQPRNRPRYQLQSAHLCRASDDSLEVAATVHARTRITAVTARFERRARQWCCTQFAVLDPGTT
ncbi:hypothetical protein GCM10009676_17150 [Prauserella halophila]|uniref:Uncharacterized protein n=1 Tax=Prauserella halophila TaxID=185641 RepID=A0ABN1W481_9PSEU|nr:Rv3235 family protein [Prauserella halophila]MCP2236080.1 hypothetical protein [Prauserella halophila]